MELDQQVTVYCFLEKLVGGFLALKGAWAWSYKSAPRSVLIRKSPIPISPTSSLPSQNALARPPPSLRLSWKYSFSLFLVCPLLSFLGWNGTKGWAALGPLGSLHFHKSQINGLWCRIQQALSSARSHSHGLHRPNSGPVPHLQTPVMPALPDTLGSSLTSRILL